MKIFKIALSSVLSLQIALAGLIPFKAFADEHPRSSGSEGLAERAYGEIDPIWQKFAASEPTSDFQLKFNPNDPAIDQDPFFMRSQSWVKGSTSHELTWAPERHGLSIGVPDTGYTLHLNLPLLPIQATQDFIFLSLDSKSDLFARAAGSNAEPGEGVFFLSRADLAQQAKSGKPAPLFFFPLSGHGWAGQLDSIEMPQADVIVLANKTETISIELQDVESVMKAEMLNLTVAATLAVRNRGTITNPMLPGRGMTAAFGVFFTGVDLDAPEKSLWALNEETSSAMKAAFRAIAHSIGRFNPFVESEAHASILSPALVSRLVFVGSVLSGMLIASVVIKYADPRVRKKLKDLRPKTDVPLTAGQVVRREIKETFDVNSAVTTTVAQVASVTFANSLELFLDRFAPTAAAADHTLIRRFLNTTFFFSRDSMKNVPTNSKTFIYGALVLGTIDTACVAIQYIFAVPFLAKSAMAYVGQSMRARINDTFDPNNANTKNLALQDTVRNGISYLQSGASSYSLSARSQVIEGITKEVEEKMRGEGKDPNDPKFQSAKSKAIEEKMNIVMKQKGLPDNSQFLFDANSAFSNIAKILGYKTPEGVGAQESFILEKRFGLSKNALKKAITAAETWAAAERSATARETVAILKETLDSMSFLKNGVKYGKEGIQRARLARQQLTLLSYEGSISWTQNYLPETWKTSYSPEAANAAGLIFRESLYSYLTKEGDNLIFANKADMEELGDRAHHRALKQIFAEHKDLNPTEPLPSAFDFELKLRTQVETVNIAREVDTKVEANNYRPPKLDWLARRQQAVALQTADHKMDAYLLSEKGQAASDDEKQAMKLKFIREAFAREVGLRIEDRDGAAKAGRTDYVSMLDTLDKKTEADVDQTIKNDLGLRRYLDKQRDAEKAKILSTLYATTYLQNYKEAATELEMVKATDPAQPGRFQRLRQTAIVRSSPFLTRTLRVLESFGDDQTLGLGFKDAIARNIPFANDLYSTHRRTLKTILPALSVSYAWNYYAWQVHLPYATWIISVLAAAATVATPSQWLNRVFRMNGLKAMGSAWSQVLFAFPYSWVTFLGFFPVMMYSKSAGVWFSDYVQTPVMSVIDRVDAKDILAAATATGLTIAIKKITDVRAQAEKTKTIERQLRAPLTCNGLLTSK